MPLAFLILAHRNPAQVARLFSVLWHREDTFVLHFDRRAPQALHALSRRLADGYPNVHLMPPRAVVWGGPVGQKTSGRDSRRSAAGQDNQVPCA